MMVPAHAVQVSVSVPVLVSGPLTPCFRFTCQSERKRKTLKLCFERRVWSCERICMKTSRPRERLHRGAVTAASGAAKQKMETWSREVKECPEQTQVTVCCMWINSNIYFVIHIKQNIFSKDSASLLFFPSHKRGSPLWLRHIWPALFLLNKERAAAILQAAEHQ